MNMDERLNRLENRGSKKRYVTDMSDEELEAIVSETEEIEGPLTDEMLNEILAQHK